MGSKVPQEQKLKSTKVVCGANVPPVQKFHGTKVLGLFAPRERMFHGTKVPRERKFSLWTFRSLERNCRGTTRPGIVAATYWRAKILYERQSRRHITFGSWSIQSRERKFYFMKRKFRERSFQWRNFHGVKASASDYSAAKTFAFGNAWSWVQKVLCGLHLAYTISRVLTELGLWSSPAKNYRRA